MGIDEIYLRVWQKQQEWTGTRWGITTFFMSISFALFGFSLQGNNLPINNSLQRLIGLSNYWFSSVVRIQADRGHVVCDSGPYRIVRHPGYAGYILPLLGIVLALGSLWTLIPAAVALVIAVIRTALEDRTLQEELPGYQEYARRVRYRLFPGIY